ncbi:phosphate signaling complex PhoU family protein [Nocardia stercoris]|uniref:Phosphate uptake regulator, PhoU n=1 Tax=Nocardia stercoris TaxID=2483361 RepID=A0A3M2LCI4_9NOCA|nr:PhoU domain-containing protein [Nocardia stercoris]RMI34430.1 phosphate uptake regulator, PhoU [Nocardia stercoris]
MRTKFSSELAALTDDLARLAKLARDAAELAMVAVADANLTVAYEVFALGEQLQLAYGACENRAVLLLALEAPVARDLRHVVSAIQIADDLSQIGRLTDRIAETVVRHYPKPIAPPDLLATLGAIGSSVVTLATAAGHTITDRHPVPPAATGSADDTVPQRVQQLLSTVTAAEWPHGSATAVDLALLAHHWERCTAHLIRIGRLIQFFHTGVPLSADPE